MSFRNTSCRNVVDLGFQKRFGEFSQREKLVYLPKVEPESPADATEVDFCLLKSETLQLTPTRRAVHSDGLGGRQRSPIARG